MQVELLKTAQQSLRIQDVALRSAHVTLSEGFEPKYDSIPMEAQFRQRTSRSEELELANGDNVRRLFRVFVDVGIRWVRARPDAPTSEGEGDAVQSEPEVLAMIEATFIAEYDVQGKPSEDALSEFALHNAPWHIWPYWREYVASHCARMNLAKVTMPLQCLPSSPEPGEAQP